jgi:PKD repeat protein
MKMRMVSDVPLLLLLALAAVFACSGVCLAQGTLTFYPVSAASIWGTPPPSSGTVADLQSDNDLYMVHGCSGAHELSVQHGYDTGYTPSEVSKITLKARLKSSRGDTPAIGVNIDNTVGGSETVVPLALRATTDTWLTWETTDVSRYLSNNGTMTVRVCGCPPSGNDHDYTVSIDEASVVLTLASPQAPLTDFTASPASGAAPLTVDFTDTSRNDATSWSWTFGDGGASALRNPRHTYLTPGAYTVALTAANASGSHTRIRTNYIGVTTGVAPPEGEGLAAHYPGDVGIENDPSVIWAEKFEEDTIGALAERYDATSNTRDMAFLTDVPPGSSGAHCLRIRHTEGDEGGLLYKSFPEGYDQLYLRFYVKFPGNSIPLHHMCKLGGYNPPTSYNQGGAGERPVGNDRAECVFEPCGGAWRWDFYAYWMEMRQYPGGKYYGNNFMTAPAFTVPKDEWICVEGMIKFNDPVDSHNGELGMWINGTLRRQNGQVVGYLGPGTARGYWTFGAFKPDPSFPAWEGFRWRSSPDLKLTFIQIEAYITGSLPPGQDGSDVLFDDVVLATQYIGPIRAGSARPVAGLTDTQGGRLSR